MRLIPPEVRAGAPFSISIPDVPEGWTARLFLRGPSAIDLEAVAGPAGAEIHAAASVTSGWGAGAYSYALRALEPGEDGAIEALESGSTRVLQDVALLAAGHDARSHAEKVLEALEAVLEGRASKDQMSYSIKGRSLALTPLADLLAMRKAYRAELASQRAAAKGRKVLGRRVQVHFR